MRFLLALLGGLVLSSGLAFALRSIVSGAAAAVAPSPLAADADDAALTAAREERARRLDHEGAVAELLPTALRETDRKLAITLRGRVPASLAESAKMRRWYWTQRCTEADRQLAFAKEALEGVGRRGFLWAALAALALACFVGAPPGRAGRAVGLVGLGALVFVLVPPMIEWNPARLVCAVGVVLVATLGALVGARLAP